MRTIDIRERAIVISRYSDPAIPPGGLTTSLVTVVTDVMRAGKPVVGYGFASVGRFAQSGLIRERFAPRLLSAGPGALADDAGTNLDPFRAWAVMMSGEKPGGHGERCVAVGTLDMAIWDAAAKIADLPLYAFIAGKVCRRGYPPARVPVYASGGYFYADRDIECLQDEMKRFIDLGFTRAKIKIGTARLSADLRRVEAASRCLGDPGLLAVDAMNTYTAEEALVAAVSLKGQELWWFEDPCDPHDFETQARVAALCPFPVAVGEALFSLSEAKLLDSYGGLNRSRDVLLFDPVHCYGLTSYLQIVQFLRGKGWSSRSFWPHGGALFSQHIACALELGGAEINPLAFAPFRGLAEGQSLVEGALSLPDGPGIGFEHHREAWQAFGVV
jgi:L-alanine-DL-glutamate epimerase-like enolase superfamily enzyme